MKIKLIDNTEYNVERVSESYNSRSKKTNLNITLLSTNTDIEELITKFTTENCATIQVIQDSTITTFNNYAYVSQIDKTLSTNHNISSIGLQKIPVSVVTDI